MRAPRARETRLRISHRPEAPEGVNQFLLVRQSRGVRAFQRLDVERSRLRSPTTGAVQVPLQRTRVRLESGLFQQGVILALPEGVPALRTRGNEIRRGLGAVEQGREVSRTPALGQSGGQKERGPRIGRPQIIVIGPVPGVFDVPIGDRPRAGTRARVCIPLDQEECLRQLTAGIGEEPCVDQNGERVGTNEKREGKESRGAGSGGCRVRRRSPTGSTAIPPAAWCWAVTARRSPSWAGCSSRAGWARPTGRWSRAAPRRPKAASICRSAVSMRAAAGG